MKYALVTGASSGIGLEMAKLLAARGYSLALVARNEEKLTSLAEELKKQYRIDCIVIACDLAKSGAPIEIFEKLKGVEIEVLINNAGFGGFGKFHSMEAKTFLEMIQVNITSLTELTHLFLPQMIARGTGRIMNVASTAAFQPGPFMAVYYATKAYVLSFSEAIGNELSDSGVTVTALCPGPTLSGFQDRAKMKASKMLKNKTLVMDSLPVAEQGVKALFEGKAIHVTGLLNRLVATSVRFAPRSFVTKLSRKITEPLTM
jgi:uncharacterized protein